MLPVGDIIQERYQIEALLGSGGLADVYRVRHLALGSLHALKVLSWDRASVDRRLLLEGRIQAQLRHPNIVAVTDVLKVDGKAALLLEYVDGPTLEDHLEEQESGLETEAALDLFAGILAAVVRAHDAGVLHRDLKPQNVLLATHGDRLVAKVTDFGLAKVVQDEMAAGNTRTNVTMGTPGYMAPEQVRDAASVDARTDVFALAVLLHELILGDRAFVDEDGHTAVTATLELRPRPLPESVPQHVRDAVEAALSRDPEGRPGDARALAEQIFLEDDPRRRDVLALGGTPLALSPRQEQVATLNSLPPGKVSKPGSLGDGTWTDEEAGSTAVPPSGPGTAPGAEPGVVRTVSTTVVVVVTLLALGAGGLGAAGLWFALGPSDATPDPLVDGNPRTQGKPVAPDPVPVAAPAPVDAPDPVPVAPEMPVAPAPAGEPSPVTATAVPAPVPSPEPSAEVAQPDVVAPDPQDPAPDVVVPAPAPQPDGTSEPDPAAEGEAEMAEMQRLLAGSWSGTTNRGQPLVVRIDRVDTDGVRGALVFTGPTARTIELSGSYGGGALTLSGAEGTRVNAAVSGDSLSGTYGKGKRLVPFTASR